MELTLILAAVALVLLVVPVIAPHTGIAGGVVCLAVATRFFWKSYVEAHVDDPTAKFNWGLDVPIGVALVLYGLLWIGIGMWSLRDEHAAIS
jgi:hypothetical protein